MQSCIRCGEKMRQEDLDTKIFSVSYSPLGVDKDGMWSTITLCDSCQRDLRNEFYRRGLVIKD